jgi:ankyrin repeat protein
LVKIDKEVMLDRDEDVMEATGLHLAAYFGVTGAVQILLDRMDINARDSKWRTPLSYAAESGRVRAVELLLEERRPPPTGYQWKHAADICSTSWIPENRTVTY